MAELLPGFAPVLLRLLLGIIFVAHGYPKLKNLKGTASWLTSVGFKPGVFWAVVLGVTEFAGGIALLLGFLTRVAVLFLFISMLVATYFKVFTWKTKFTLQEGMGYEFDLLLLAALAALFLLGAGDWSVDYMIGQFALAIGMIS